jgi:hypothetical protein
MGGAQNATSSTQDSIVFPQMLHVGGRQPTKRANPAISCPSDNLRGKLYVCAVRNSFKRDPTTASDWPAYHAVFLATLNLLCVREVAR